MENGKVRVEVELPKPLWEFLEEFGKWAGLDVKRYLTDCITAKIEGDLEYLKTVDVIVPKALEFYKRFEEAKTSF